MKLVTEIGKQSWVMDEMPVLVEGERPGETVLTAEGKIEKRELPPLEEWKDEEMENAVILDKDEFYDHVTRCKNCGTEFIAYDNKNETIRNYCPGCGNEL